MDELKRALYALMHQAGLTAAEVTTLSLQDLHLSGQEPFITVLDDQTGYQRTVKLSDSVRNALVGWMLVRPDRPVRLLFPGPDDADLTVEQIADWLQDYQPAVSEPEPVTPPLVSVETMRQEGLPEAGPGSGGSVVDNGFAPVAVGRQQPRPVPFRTILPPSSPERITAGRSDVALESVSREPSAETEPEIVSSSNRFRRAALPIVLGILGLLICGGLIVGAISILPSLPGQMARLLGPAATPLAQVDETAVLSTATKETDEESVTVTATVTANITATDIAEPTATPAPTDTAALAAAATDTPTVAATDTPLSAETVAPGETATPVPTNTATPEPTPTPSPRPTNTTAPAVSRPAPGFKYSAPQLLSPQHEFAFIFGNTVDLKWEPVGELAANEQYAVRLVYYHETEVTYRGQQVLEPQWTIPLDFYHEADGPRHEYIWYVYVERIQADGTGVPISPESEHRTFTWD